MKLTSEFWKPLGLTPTDRLWVLEAFQNFLMNYDLETYNRDNSLQQSSSLDVFFQDLPYKEDEDDIKVVTTLLLWLPSNGGLDFLYSARNLQEFLPIEDAYLGAWGIATKRNRYENNQRTLYEFLFNSSVEDKTKWNEGVTIERLETCHFFIKWLASTDGQSFLKQINL